MRESRRTFPPRKRSNILFDQANGFTTADEALRNGTDFGLKYFGAKHYWSNDHTANHLFAGVSKIERIGLLKATYGRAHTIEFPASSGATNNLSGVAAYSRADYGHLSPGGLSTLIFDVNVA